MASATPKTCEFCFDRFDYLDSFGFGATGTMWQRRPRRVPRLRDAGPDASGERGEPVQGALPRGAFTSYSHMINSLPSTSPDRAEVGYSIRSCPPSARRQYGAKYGRIALIRFDSLGSPPNPPAKMTPFALIRFDSLGWPASPPAKTTAISLDRFDSLLPSPSFRSPPRRTERCWWWAWRQPSQSGLRSRQIHPAPPLHPPPPPKTCGFCFDRFDSLNARRGSAP